MNAMILAAGLGTRLRPLTNEIPKPLVPILNEPVIVHILKNLNKFNIKNVAINLHHKSDLIIKESKKWEQLNTNFSFLYEKEILGTGGGILNASSMLKDDTFVVSNGDIYYEISLMDALKLHKQRSSIATLILIPHRDVDKKGAVKIDENGRIWEIANVGKKTKKQLQSYVFSGVHILEPEIFKLLPSNGCIVRATYQNLILKNIPIYAYVDNTGYWSDIGTLQSYLQTNLDLLKKLNQPNIINEQVKIPKTCFINNCIIGKNVFLTENIELMNCVIWNESRINQSYKNYIITPGNNINVILDNFYI